MKFAIAALLAAAAAAPATAQNYRLVWADEFEGSTLDLTKWDYMLGDGCQIHPNLCGWGNNEEQYYRAQNATVGGGTLKITARRENFGGRQYTSARLRTKDQGDWTYGRFEMRAKLPTGQGIWPAFWMLPTDDVYGTWAASGEIDIMELVGHQPNRVYGTIHYGGNFPNNTSSGGNYTLSSGIFNDDFHVFALEWDEFEMRWYVDGQLYSTKSSWWSSGGPYPAPFDERFHLLLNVAVGGNWPGSPNGSTQFPQTMEVDWVRVYEPYEIDPDACAQVFDDMEHQAPFSNDYFTFDGPGAAGAIGPNTSDVPPGVGGSASLSAGWANVGAPGFLGGFGRSNPMDLTDATHFEMWINVDAGQSGVIEVNLQDDDDGDGAIPSTPDGADDEFQYELTVGPAGTAEVVSGGGWQHVVIPFADFDDDDSFHTGGNGVFDPTPPGAGGNGELVNVVLALVSLDGSPLTFRTDRWRFTSRAARIAGRIWNDENHDGTQVGDLGIDGVTLEMHDVFTSSLVATATTSGGGQYEFASLLNGRYVVSVVESTLPDGMSPIADPDGLSTPNEFEIEVDCGEISVGLDLGYDPQFLGAKVCTPGVPNSSGSPGDIAATGSILTAQNDIELFCTMLPANQLGYFLTSRTLGFLPNAGGADGNLCVLGDIGRYRGPGQVLSSGALGLVSLPLDLTQMPQPTGFVSVTAGETWYFQLWHRDGNPGPTSNFTEALALRFQ